MIIATIAEVACGAWIYSAVGLKDTSITSFILLIIVWYGVGWSGGEILYPLCCASHTKAREEWGPAVCRGRLAEVYW